MYASTAGLQRIGSSAPLPSAIGTPIVSRISIRRMYWSAFIVCAYPRAPAISAGLNPEPPRPATSSFALRTVR